MQKVLTAVRGAALSLPLALPFAAQAEILGAEVGFEHSTYLDATARDMHKSTLGGALDYALGSNVSVQADLSQRYYGLADWDGTTFGLHGIWHTGTGAAVGAFVGKDWLDNETMEFYGLEGAMRIGALDYEAFGTIADGEDRKSYMLGLRGEYAVNDQLSLGGHLATLNADEDLVRLGATAKYEFLPGYLADAELGLADPDNSDKEVFLSVGIKAVFGPGKGVTFGRRGLQEILPGY